MVQWVDRSTKEVEEELIVFPSESKFEQVECRREQTRHGIHRAVGE